ncbi:MAG: carbamoyl-phosphate synthase large subunit [Proteobacteria bacterium]|nr:carbamoyl-phosphate synthase large subunit [Pseudomonadota bacterium]
MPKRTEIKKILLIGSGPIVIGQACEFDYSGTQACKTLKEEGYEVVLVNSNPATIMTDPEFADRTYIEPLSLDYLEDIIKKERPQAVLPTMGGQTALNLAMALSEKGILKKYQVELIGAKEKAIKLAESRELFKEVLTQVGVDFPKSGLAHNLDEGIKIVERIGFPVVIRASFTLGGTGAAFAYNIEEFRIECAKGLEASPVSEVLIEESVLGWKEYELEVVRDCKDNVVIVCSIENFDPMGVHTGDSITVAPQQTLTDREYQQMRDAALRIIRAVGVDTGGSNIQFAVDPKTGRQVAIEMNPRVSRSSALASKATGFPIAKIATKLAIGYTLDEIPNDITKKTPSCFEPSIDYVVTKIPRFAFEKFPNSDSRLSPSMKSVGEAMAIGRTFKESLQKAMRSLENKWWGFNPIAERRRLRSGNSWIEGIRQYIQTPKADRLIWIAQAFREGITLDEIHVLTHIDPWFLRNIEEIVSEEKKIAHWAGRLNDVPFEELRHWKRLGFSDDGIAYFLKSSAEQVRAKREQLHLKPVYKMVDTCSAEFISTTPYYYSAYEKKGDDVISTSQAKKVIILGGGPNRIGQGIEFDYCCVQASFALREEGYESIMVNCNPETVSTDYDISNKLYFEPLFLEDILHIIEREKPEGIVVHFGGQTPLNLSRKLARLNIPIMGTSAEAIEIAEDRDKFRALCYKLEIKQPESVTVSDPDRALEAAEQLGFPLLVRPSFVLGGRGMEIIYNSRDFQKWLLKGAEISEESPLLIDRFLNNATEVDVDAISDGEDVTIVGMMEQIQEAGVHSGDSACSLPPMTLSEEIQKELERQTRLISLELKVKGLINIQFAIERGEIFVLEVNPRASRTVPFASKAKGIPYAKIAMKVMMGQKLKDLRIPEPKMDLVYVKESVFPFTRFTGTDVILGPEMRSTGEVMGVGKTFGEAFGKSTIAAGFPLPKSGKAFLSVKDDDKEVVKNIALKLVDLGFEICATRGTADALKGENIRVSVVNKVNEGRPHVVDHIKNGEIHLVVNTSALGVHEVGAAYELRRATLMRNLCYFTTLASAKAGVQAISQMKKINLETHCLQER